MNKISNDKQSRLIYKEQGDCFHLSYNSPYYFHSQFRKFELILFDFWKVLSFCKQNNRKVVKNKQFKQQMK